MQLESTLTCPQCGALFISVQKHQRFCSPRCKNRFNTARRSIPESQCVGCGKVFRPKQRKYSTYCTRECAWEHWRDYVILPRGLEPQPIACQVRVAQCDWCKKWFYKKGPSSARPWSRHCSDGCRYEQTKANLRARYLEQRPPVERMCEQCGRCFITRLHADRKYCSARCAANAAKGQRRARLRGVQREVISRNAVFVRDGGRCMICRKPILRNKRAPHPLSFTLDHVIPLSLGGAHVFANVQAAHFACNSRRGNKGVAQLRLLG